MKSESGLSPQQLIFAHELAKGTPQAVAYRKAYSARGKSDNAINSNASRLAKNDKVLSYIQAMLDEARGQAEAARALATETKAVVNAANMDKKNEAYLYTSLN